MLKKSVIIGLAILLAVQVFAVRKITVTTPDVSQKSAVMQRVGLTDIVVKYYSPAVNKRNVWGKLVPYGKVWRVGANENTVVKFSGDVKVEGKALKKGLYGLHMIPGKDSWTIIFSKNNTSWGSYFYKQDEDALRVTVTPVETAHHEWLSFDFNEKGADYAVLAMNWGKLRVPVKISVDVKQQVVANFRRELKSLPFWYWRGTYGAAKYCLDNDVNLEEALTWVKQSISVEENFLNTILKSELLAKLGKAGKATAVKKRAMKIATEREMTQYAYSFVPKNKKRSETILLKNIKRYKTWTSYRAIARLYNYIKEKEKAIKYFKLAWKKAPKKEKAKLKKTIDGIK